MTERLVHIPLKGGQLVAINLDRGTIRWTLDIATAFTPASGEGLVFIAGDQTIEARDAETGANRWSDAAARRRRGAAVLRHRLAAGVNDLRRSHCASCVGWRRRLASSVGRAVGRTAGTGARQAVFLSLEDNRLVSVLLTNGEMVWARVMPRA